MKRGNIDAAERGGKRKIVPARSRSSASLVFIASTLTSDFYRVLHSQLPGRKLRDRSKIQGWNPRARSPSPPRFAAFRRGTKKASLCRICRYSDEFIAFNLANELFPGVSWVTRGSKFSLYVNSSEWVWIIGDSLSQDKEMKNW